MTPRRSPRDSTVDEMRAPILAHFKGCPRCKKGWSRRDRCEAGEKLHTELTDSPLAQMREVLKPRARSPRDRYTKGKR